MNSHPYLKYTPRTPVSGWSVNRGEVIFNVFARDPARRVPIWALEDGGAPLIIVPADPVGGILHVHDVAVIFVSGLDAFSASDETFAQATVALAVGASYGKEAGDGVWFQSRCGDVEVQSC